MPYSLFRMPIDAGPVLLSSAGYAGVAHTIVSAGRSVAESRA